MIREELIKGAKPMLFNTEMARAILCGRKTVTRRVMNPQPTFEDMFASALRPPCKYDDILYVRETWAYNYDYEKYPWETEEYIYRADADKGKFDPLIPEWFRGWKPSIHMPKEAARIFLRVTEVHVERLKDITEEQAEAEGCYRMYETKIGIPARSHFGDLWDSTIKATDRSIYGWDADPWVWVITFERIPT